MNNGRRKEIEKCITALNSVLTTIENIKDDEQDYYDNIPENLCNSMNAFNSETALENLEEATDSLEEAIENINEVITSLWGAM